jgi:hypothetical protein
MSRRYSVDQHLAGRNHGNKLLHLERLQRKLKAKGSRSENVGVAKNLEAHIESLGLTRWRWEVRALLLEGDQNDKPGIAAEALLNEVRHFDYMRNLTKKELMENIEKFTFLEHEVWKTRLTSDPFLSTREAEVDIHWTPGCHIDPDAKTGEPYETSGIQVLVQSVLPFLE